MIYLFFHTHAHIFSLSLSLSLSLTSSYMVYATVNGITEESAEEREKKKNKNRVWKRKDTKHTLLAFLNTSHTRLKFINVPSNPLRSSRHIHPLARRPVQDIPLARVMHVQTHGEVGPHTGQDDGAHVSVMG